MPTATIRSVINVRRALRQRLRQASDRSKCAHQAALIAEAASSRWT